MLRLKTVDSSIDSRFHDVRNACFEFANVPFILSLSLHVCLPILIFYYCNLFLKYD